MSNPDEIRKTLGNERLIALLRDVDYETAQVDEDHLADDAELLERWENQLLTVPEHDAVLKHLAACHECSQYLHDMTRAGAFGNAAGSRDAVVTIVDSEKKPTDRNATPVVRLTKEIQQSESRSTRWFAMTTVACALVAVLGFLISREGSNPAELRLAQSDLGQLLHYLHEADFAAVVLPGEIKSGSQPYPVLPDAGRDRKLQRLAALIKSDPQDLGHRLNFGQLLLEAGRHEDALAEFQAAEAIDSGNSYVQLGLGLAQFRTGAIAAAERKFAASESDSVVGVNAKVNRVLCLMALDRKMEARDLWSTIPPESQNERIRKALSSGIE